MKINDRIFLPGTDRQAAAFIQNIKIEKKSLLIIGAGTEEIAGIFSEQDPAEIFIIVDNEDSLFELRLTLSERGLKKAEARLMDFSNTDFKDEKFDIIYSQGSTGTKYRNKIIKEIKRILKPEGYFCTGEIISKSENPPRFVKDIWENSGLSPLNESGFKKYFTEKGFREVLEEDLTATLKEFYQSAGDLQEKTDNLSEKEKSFYKKIINKISHESNVYLKLGGDKHIGFRMLILQKI